MEFSELNWLDVAVITIVFVSSLLAFFRGFLKALFSLITWVGSALVAIFFAPDLQVYLSNYSSNELVTKIASYIAIFIVAFVILALINSKILFLIRGYRKSFFDKTLGLAFGFARGVLIVCLFFFCVSTVSSMIQYGGVEEKGAKRYGPDFFVNAKTYNLMNYSTEIILAILPDGLQVYLVERVTEVKDRVVKSMTEGEMKDALPRALNKEEMKMIADVKSAIPDEVYEEIKNKYRSKGDNLSEIDKISIFRDILSAYNESRASGSTKDGKVIDEESVKMLDNILNGTQIDNKDIPENEGTGYKEKNIKQLDRLVDSVNEE